MYCKEDCNKDSISVLENKLKFDNELMIIAEQQLNNYNINNNEIKNNIFNSLRNLINIIVVAENEYNFSCCSNFKSGCFNAFMHHATIKHEILNLILIDNCLISK